MFRKLIISAGVFLSFFSYSAMAATEVFEVRAILRAQAPEALDAIRGAIRDGAKAFERAGVTEIPMPAVLASAAKH
ncbi:MAG: hypothetical protein IIA14_05620 [SAR324 cluster bacterium]|nr:hypothetical protein [SAR324 cluster bacterium]